MYTTLSFQIVAYFKFDPVGRKIKSFIGNLQFLYFALNLAKNFSPN